VTIRRFTTFIAESSSARRKIHGIRNERSIADAQMKSSLSLLEKTSYRPDVDGLRMVAHLGGGDRNSGVNSAAQINSAAEPPKENQSRQRRATAAYHKIGIG
jgi:hypothetical protein